MNMFVKLSEIYSEIITVYQKKDNKSISCTCVCILLQQWKFLNRGHVADGYIVAIN